MADSPDPATVAKLRKAPSAPAVRKAFTPLVEACIAQCPEYKDRVDLVAQQ